MCDERLWGEGALHSSVKWIERPETATWALLRTQDYDSGVPGLSVEALTTVDIRARMLAATRSSIPGPWPE